MKPIKAWMVKDSIGPIRVMAVAEGYAMVRRPRCSPFAVPVKQLETMERVEIRERKESK